ncbi:MAG: PKD domain-containing protein, partial [Anaerolineae bacterium]
MGRHDQEMVGYATFDLRDHVYLVGGGPSQAVSYSPVLADGALGPWQSTVALPAQRSRLRAGGYNCFVYALGGYDGSLYQDTVYYARLQAPCEPVSSLQLSRAPSGSLFAGVTVQFMANAGGTVPFTYTWTLDGAPVGENLSTFHHTFATSGTYSVGVTVENACGQAEETMIVEVQGLAPGQPDLSPSRKVVNLSSVEIGDVLTYTILLHNDSATVATANLTDLVPLHTTYLPGTARASDGGSVTLTGGELQWSGQVISGIPVLVSFAVEVQAVPLGTQITNTAYLDDGLGNVLLLTADSLYNPGFGLSIDDGALYTNIPTVTLHYTWDAADDITHVKLSNDGGFGPEGNTTDWLPVDPDNPTYIDWVLATYGQLTLPRTVYAKFRDLSGKQYGPVQDDIIYDPDLPLVKVVEIIPQETRGAAPRQGQNVIVRVTASDPNSGVAKIQLSHDYAFGQFSEYASAGPTTDIAWTLQLSGLVYVRVVDRAGNVSDVVSEQGTTRIYLPAV